MTEASITNLPSLYQPLFPKTWDEVVLYDLARWINGMAFREFHFTPNGRPILKIAEIKNGITAQTKFSVNSYDDDYSIQPGDMLFSWSGQPETSIDAFIWRGPVGWLNQHIFKVLVNSNHCSNEFFFYLLKYLKPNFIRIAHNKQTTGLGHVTKADLQRMVVRIPKRSVQDSISGILSVLDDKIELLRRQNDTLETIAQTLFKEWFVEFNFPDMNGRPYKASGGKMMDSEMGFIPEGWRVGTLEDLLTLEYGKALREDRRTAGPVPVYGSNGQVGWHNEKLLSGPGIVVGRKGNPGTVNWVDSDYFPIDTVFYVVPKHSSFDQHYLFYALKEHNLPRLEADSAVPGLNRNLAYMSEQVVPNPKVIKEFADMVSALFAKCHADNEQIRTISNIRDGLLPKLMSGELRVGGA